MKKIFLVLLVFVSFQSQASEFHGQELIVMMAGQNASGDTLLTYHKIEATLMTAERFCAAQGGQEYVSHSTESCSFPASYPQEGSGREFYSNQPVKVAKDGTYQIRSSVGRFLVGKKCLSSIECE